MMKNVAVQFVKEKLVDVLMKDGKLSKSQTTAFYWTGSSFTMDQTQKASMSTWLKLKKRKKYSLDKLQLLNIFFFEYLIV